VKILARQIGHTLGIGHDFQVGNKAVDRYSDHGILCTRSGEVMDNFHPVTRWSSCSVEDFYFIAFFLHHVLMKLISWKIVKDLYQQQPLKY